MNWQIHDGNNWSGESYLLSWHDKAHLVPRWFCCVPEHARLGLTDEVTKRVYLQRTVHIYRENTIIITSWEKKAFIKRSF